MEAQYQSDKFYKSSYNKYKSHDLMISAGWINEIQNNNGIKIDYSLDLLTTPLSGLSFSSKKKNKILLTTGSFGPFHKGHLNMMLQAKKELENEGYHVAGGYISPSHDNYVLTKDNMHLSIYDRIDSIEDLIEEEKWLMLDRYEALHTPIPINFTTVITRLNKYISKHLGIDADIVYVFGGDNIKFSYAFVEFGEFVCVSREKNFTVELENFSKDKRHRFVYDNNRIVEEASKRIRYLNREKKKFDDNKHYYLIRDDIKASLFFDVNKSSIEELGNIIKHYTKKEIIIMDMEKQLSLLKKDNGLKTVSLDLYYKGDVNLNLCRLFNVSDTQSKPLRMICRDNNGYKLDMIKNSSVILVDDDKASGQTVSLVKEILLKQNINIKEEVFLNELYIVYKGLKSNDIYDIVDARDFILGAKYGGLCTLLPNNTIVRSIYSYPYVNLKNRAKIETKYHQLLSIDIWEWNKTIFTNDAKLSDLCPLTQSFMKYIGFKNEALVIDICNWHIDKIKGIL